MDGLKSIVDLIRSLYHEQEAFIPLHDPRFIGNEKKYLEECIDSNFVSSVGEFVGKFERMCAEYTGSKYAVAAMNGTAALHVALQLCGVKRDDEVITQSLTFIATANAITYTGAKPVFLDVDRETMGLSPDRVERWLAENAEKRGDSAYNKKTGRRIAACVPMHTFGHPVKIDRLAEVLESYNIPLIEDAAESLGSLFRGKHTGTFGRAGILSFNGNKIITTGGGGMILTDDEKLAVKAKHITTQAKVPHAWEYVHDMTGYNYRLTNINAALGCAQMETLDQFIALKRELAFQYREFFKDSEFIFFDELEGCRSNFWLNVIITKDRKRRDEVLEYTNSKGVMTRPIWELMNRLPMYRDYQTDGLENSCWFADRVVNLPSSAYIEGYGKRRAR
jgi:aminotransferase in exopolysaccharide biosynthesis